MKAERVYLIAVTCFAFIFASGCRERNPAYIKALPDASVTGLDAGDDVRADASRDGRTKDAADAPDDTVGGSDAVDLSRETGVSDAVDAPSDPAGDVDSAANDARDGINRDTRDVRRDDVGTPTDLSGQDLPADAPIVSDGAIDSIGATDSANDDGVTPPVDAAPVCQESDTRACSSRGNPLIGACHAGTQTCVGGVWGACVGEVLPAAETCNGTDDNCNGLVDEGCTADCVIVAPTGDDTNADGTAAHPFATITRAMNFAATAAVGAPARVCVAGGASCSERKTYSMSGVLDMIDGARVQGSYALAGGTLSYCAATPPTTTLEFPATGDGIVFGGSVTSGELGGFSIARVPATNPTTGSMAGVVVKGGKISLSTLFIGAQGGVENTYGVAVEDGTVTLTDSSIEGGQGTASAAGVLVSGGTVNLRNNCALDVNGFCLSSCAASSAGQILGIRGRSSVSGGPGTGGSSTSSAVYAKGGSVSVVGNNLCGGAGNASDAGSGASLATLRCENGACATVMANAISTTSNNVKQIATVSLADGGGELTGNTILGGCGSDFATGVLLNNAAAGLRNNRIVGGQCTGGGAVYGVRIILGTGAGEPELHSNDIEPAGGGGDCQSTGVSIERSVGASVVSTILRNNIISTGVCRKRYAVVEQSNASARIIENNDLYPPASPSTVDSTILYSRADSNAVTADQVNALAGAASNLAVDPRYVAFPTDMHLTSNSPCIDRGTTTGAPATDFAGTSRPQGAGFDIGAYELLVP